MGHSEHNDEDHDNDRRRVLEEEDYDGEDYPNDDNNDEYHDDTEHSGEW